MEKIDREKLREQLDQAVFIGELIAKRTKTNKDDQLIALGKALLDAGALGKILDLLGL